MQRRDKTGVNNPMFGKLKSSSTIAKLTKLVVLSCNKSTKGLWERMKRQWHEIASKAC